MKQAAEDAMAAELGRKTERAAPPPDRLTRPPTPSADEKAMREQARLVARVRG